MESNNEEEKRVMATRLATDMKAIFKEQKEHGCSEASLKTLEPWIEIGWRKGFETAWFYVSQIFGEGE